MHVALNAQLLSRAQTFRSGGISRVIAELLRELARDPRGHRYEIFAPAAPHPKDGLAGTSLRYHATGTSTIRPAVRIAWEQSRLPRHLAALRPDLLHNLAYASPLLWRGPTVLTIYDLSFLRFPEAFNRGNRLYLSAVTRLSARRARRVLTISEHSKADIVRLLGVPPERIDVTYPAADARYRLLPDTEVAAHRRAHSLPERFIFTLGTLEPRKNLAGLLRAYAHMPSPRVPLYVAGGTGWRFTPIFDLVQRLELDRDIVFLGFVPEEELPLWYNAARIFAYPSLYEGFGLPVVEAMACGTPVITSTASSLPEAAGTAAVLVPPDDTIQIAQQMQHILETPSQWEQMRAAGLAQSRRFSWRTLADGTVASYHAAAVGA